MSFLCFDHNLNKISLDNKFQHQRSFLYGDGHFTTAKIVDGNIQFLADHLLRLQQANDRLKFNSVNWTALEKVLIQTAADLALGFIRVHVSRGQSVRGYGQCAQIEANVFVSYAELTAPFVKELSQDKPIQLTQLNTQLGLQPLLAGLKHCNRLEQVLASAELEQTGFSDGLVADINGNLIETTKANVIWYQQGRWFTPLLTNSGVSGVMLKQLISQIDLVEVEQSMEQVSTEAEAMIICNSLVGLQIVSSINARILDTEVSAELIKGILIL